MMIHVKKVIGPLFFLLINGCSIAPPAGHGQILLSQDTYVTSGNSPQALLRKGEAVGLGTEPVYLQAPGYVSLLVVPLGGTSQSVFPSLRPIDEWGGEAFESALNSKVNELVAGINDVEVLLGKARIEEAIAKIELLQRRYPKVTCLNVIKASALFLSGERSQAKAVLDDAMRQGLPSDSGTLEFYRMLSGSREAPMPAAVAAGRKEGSR